LEGIYLGGFGGFDLGRSEFGIGGMGLGFGNLKKELWVILRMSVLRFQDIN
jgi:hypothetical protein